MFFLKQDYKLGLVVLFLLFTHSHYNHSVIFEVFYYLIEFIFVKVSRNETFGSSNVHHFV